MSYCLSIQYYGAEPVVLGILSFYVTFTIKGFKLSSYCYRNKLVTQKSLIFFTKV